MLTFQLLLRLKVHSDVVDWLSMWTQPLFSRLFSGSDTWAETQREVAGRSKVGREQPSREKGQHVQRPWGPRERDSWQLKGGLSCCRWAPCWARSTQESTLLSDDWWTLDLTEELSASPGTSAVDFLPSLCVFPLHLCLAVCDRPAQSSPWRKFIISPVGSSEVGLATGLVGASPVVCFFLV